jgi:hypothetical protein
VDPFTGPYGLGGESYDLPIFSDGFLGPDFAQRNLMPGWDLFPADHTFFVDHRLGCKSL